MKSRTTILIEESLLRKLKKQAFEEDTSVTAIIERLIKEYFDKNVKVDKLLWIKNTIEKSTDESLKQIVITPSLEEATSITSLTVSLFDIKNAIGTRDISDIKRILVFTSLAFVRKILNLIDSNILYAEQENLNPFSIELSIKRSSLNEQNKRLLANSILSLSDSFPNVSYLEGEDLKIIIKQST